jgi:hypothetical protein
MKSELVICCYQRVNIRVYHHLANFCFSKEHITILWVEGKIEQETGRNTWSLNTENLTLYSQSCENFSYTHGCSSRIKGHHQVPKLTIETIRLK